MFPRRFTVRSGTPRPLMPPENGGEVCVSFCSELVLRLAALVQKPLFHTAICYLSKGLSSLLCAMTHTIFRASVCSAGIVSDTRRSAKARFAGNLTGSMSFLYLAEDRSRRLQTQCSYALQVMEGARRERTLADCVLHRLSTVITSPDRLIPILATPL